MKNRFFPVLALVVILSLLLAACGGGAAPEPTSAPAPTAAPTEAPAPTEEPYAYGTADNPIVWVLVPSQDTDAVLSGASGIAAAVEEATGYVIEPVISTDFTAAVEAMCSGEAQMGALNTFNYIVAKQRGCAEVGLVSMRFGSTFYTGQIVTRPETGITSLADLVGTTFCRPDPTSTSGWVLPSIAIKAQGIDPEAEMTIVDAGGHDGVIISVYNGDCDAGSSFTDARTNVAEAYPDVNEVVTVLTESAPIPNDTISFDVNMPDDVKAAIIDALLALNDSEDGLAQLNQLYSWSGLATTEDSFYDGFRQQLEAAGMCISDAGRISEDC
ncbi:MAG: phosphate/phosphite/phosphonate ABC transporter substrate-binding protein [Anaerolineales bacterium]|nr:MAG: phosphate/phosphite/phosphonate ABC transporter substrate-binding protein [Anaerolineales bacterium]